MRSQVAVPRAVPMDYFSPPLNQAPDHPALAVIFERSSRTAFDVSQISAQFHLTPREQETLEYLIEGLSESRSFPMVI